LFIGHYRPYQHLVTELVEDVLPSINA